MYLILLGWLYVVGMVALTTATHPQGSVLQAILVFLFVGMLPMGLAHYILGHGARRRKRLLEEQESVAPSETAVTPAASGSDQQPDGSSHTPGA